MAGTLQQRSQIQQASFIAWVRVALMRNVKFCIVTDIWQFQRHHWMIFPGLLDQMIYLLLSECQVKMAGCRSHSFFADKVKVFKNVKMEVNKEANIQPSLSIKLGQWIIYCIAKVSCLIMNQEWHVIFKEPGKKINCCSTRVVSLMLTFVLLFFCHVCDSIAYCPQTL